MVLNVILQINTAKLYAIITLFPIGGVFHKKFTYTCQSQRTVAAFVQILSSVYVDICVTYLWHIWFRIGTLRRMHSVCVA